MTGPEFRRPAHACRVPRADTYRLGDRWSCWCCSSSWRLVRYSSDVPRRWWVEHYPRRHGAHRLGPDGSLWQRRHTGRRVWRWLDRLGDELDALATGRHR